MALVKFISEKDCQLIIDMEQTAIVHTNEMTKINLEPGDYLIEAKDDNGNTLKRYKLNIKTADTQILQNLTTIEDDIDETIKKLKDDSTIQFHNQRAVFCYNGNYGYINSQYRIVIHPMYSYADEFVNNKAFVRRIFPEGEKATIIDIGGNILLEQWYDFIGCNEEQILLKKSYLYYVFTKYDYTVIKEYKDAGYNNKANLIPVYQEIGVDDYYGFIDESGIEIIPCIYDHVWNFDNNGFAKVKRFGIIYVVDSKGSLFYNIEEAIKDSKQSFKGNDIIEEPKTENASKVFVARKLSKAESIIRGLDIGPQIYPIKEGNEWGLGGYMLADIKLNEKGEYVSYREVPTNEISSHRCDRIIHYDDEYQIYRKDGICSLFLNDTLFSSRKEYKFIADEIILNIRWKHTFEGYEDTLEINNLIIKKNRKYGIVNLKGEIILPTEYDFIATTDAIEQDTTGNIGIIWKNGLCSLVYMETGEILMPFKYEDIIVNDADANWYLINSTFIIKEKGKYGCIDFYGKTILSPVYDAIDVEWGDTSDGYHYIMQLHKDEKVGIYEYCEYNMLNGRYTRFDLYIDPQFDDCIISDRGAVYGISKIYLRKGNKWGIFDKTQELPVYGIYENVDCSICHSRPDMDDIDFKYNSIKEAKSHQL